MPLPLPTLDDRRFEDLAQEARARVAAHTPEWTQLNPGDPGVALIDLFAWLTDTIIYRVNLIPLRQRRAFLNLLRIPMRPAAPARGVVCLDAPPAPSLPGSIEVGGAILRPASGTAVFTGTTELQPTWLECVPMVKARYVETDPVKRQETLALLASIYPQANASNQDAKPLPFIAQRALQSGPLPLDATIDGSLYVALLKPPQAKLPADAASLRGMFFNKALSLGFAPPDDTAATMATEPAPRRLEFSIATKPVSGAGTRWLPLETLLDTSRSLRRPGVVQLLLPSTISALEPPEVDDPMFAGVGSSPPELPADVTPDRLMFWLRMQSPDDPSLSLAWLGVNALEIEARETGRDALLGIGNGEADQAFALPLAPVDPASLAVEMWPPAIETDAGPVAQGGIACRQVDTFGAAGRDDLVFTLDPASGVIQFGDGVRGARMPNGAAVYARKFSAGGGADGNLPAGAIKQVDAPGLKVRHEWPTKGGVAAETVAEAERRIPAFLANRDRAVTEEDFAWIARSVPGWAVARAEVIAGFMPGIQAAASRTDVPGVVSVFVIPPGERRLAGAPRPVLGLLRAAFDWVRARALIGTQLFVLSPEYVGIGVWISVRLIDETTRTGTLRAVRQALVDYLWPLEPGGPLETGWPMGRAVALDELRTQAGRVPGLLAADNVVLYSKIDTGWATVNGNLNLLAYQLPDLLGVTVAVTTDSGSTPAPPWDESGQMDGGQPVPFIPDRC